MKKPLIFVHIPKTAGSTIHSILNDQYNRKYTIRGNDDVKFIDIAKFKSFSEKKKNQFDIVKGHLTGQLIDDFEEPIVFTFLRDPLSQFVSSYNYLHLSKSRKATMADNNVNNINEFLEYYKSLNRDNVQTRHLSNEILIPENDENINSDERGEEIFRKALANLNKMDYVFITEQFDQSILLLEKYLAWNKRPFYFIQNKSKKLVQKEELSDEFLKNFNEVYKYDIALYEVAKKRHNEQLKSNPIDEELKQFQMENQAYQKNSNRKIINFLYRVEKKLKNTLRNLS